MRTIRSSVNNTARRRNSTTAYVSAGRRANRSVGVRRPGLVLLAGIAAVCVGTAAPSANACRRASVAEIDEIGVRVRSELVNEAVLSHRGAGAPEHDSDVRDAYDFIFEQGQQFAQPLAEILRGQEQSALSAAEIDEIALVLSRGRDGWGDETASARARSYIQSRLGGYDVFARFEGEWRGEWLASPGDLPASYRHAWFPTRSAHSNGDVYVQLVAMRPLGGDAGESVAVAVNAIDVHTGVVTGAVITEFDAKTGEPTNVRRCAGYFLGPGRIIWLCLERSTGEQRSFSLFLETVDGDVSAVYQVRGVEFRWTSPAGPLESGDGLGRPLNQTEGLYFRPDDVV